MSEEDKHTLHEARLILENTEVLYNTALSIDTEDEDAIRKLSEEVVTVIEDNTGKEFGNFMATTQLVSPVVAMVSQQLQEENAL